MITYSTNNSGGGWWLDDEDWKALEAAGWKVDWYADDVRNAYYGANGRWLGALATTAHREGLDMDEAIEEWERVTGQDAEDEGCSCCGAPHSFYEAPLVGELIDGKELE
ncbi:hypothetical protein SEA_CALLINALLBARBZ_55 [Arthrobacter phage CallinAllBarbz]|uniref:Uncharacterized protein n=1 Tax=Arthrobacter phage CallinAllBarbz TaxID=3077790 RepID=A0AA96HEN0_9CAUD|nr:hypothetical protein SEA_CALLINALLBARBZ_55 [Arthrobacter phage CallinAllBarbz]